MNADAGLFREDLDDFDTDAGDQPDVVDDPARVPPAQRDRPAPHGRKLRELLTNPKLPEADRARVEATLARADDWVREMAGLQSIGDDKVRDLVELCNAYKRYVELDLIWDSEAEFLYRQRGQLKLDNSIIEEFLPWLIDPMVIPELCTTDCSAGPRKAFAAASFASTLVAPGRGCGLMVRSKNQDFALSRQAFLHASFSSDFPEDDTVTHAVNLAYLAAECKTNLDKTMFQEASATAHDLKVALPGARYYLLTEYLDMKPIGTVGTDIDEVLVLRGRRMSAHLRKNNSDPNSRAATRAEYAAFLDASPMRTEVILRFVNHIRELFANVDPAEEDVLARGYF